MPCLTLVTLDRTPFDIETSVSRVSAAVYSPTVQRPRGQAGRVETVPGVEAQMTITFTRNEIATSHPTARGQPGHADASRNAPYTLTST